jgi:hypothetical protein
MDNKPTLSTSDPSTGTIKSPWISTKGQRNTRDSADGESSACPSRSPRQIALGDWIYPLPWNWFSTLTFRTAVHPEQADRRFKRFIKALTTHPARRVTTGPIIWVRGAELQRRGVLHFHALVAGVAPIPVFAACKLWEQIGGGHAQIYPYTWSLGAAYYVGKGGEVDFSPVWFEP